jgi:hypothetical protein
MLASSVRNPRFKKKKKKNHCAHYPETSHKSAKPPKYPNSERRWHAEEGSLEKETIAEKVTAVKYTRFA